MKMFSNYVSIKQELIGCQSFHKVNCSISSGQKNRNIGSQKQFSVSNIEEVYAMLIATVFEADESESSRQDILAASWLVVRTLYVIRVILYWILSLIGNQWRRSSIGVMCSDLHAGADHRAGQRVLVTVGVLSMLHWEVPWRILLQ